MEQMASGIGGGVSDGGPRWRQLGLAAAAVTEGLANSGWAWRQRWAQRGAPVVAGA